MRSERDGLDIGNRAIENVAGDHDSVHLVSDRLLKEPPQKGALGVQEIDTVESPAQMPVGRVKQAHIVTLLPTSDNRDSTHRMRGQDFAGTTIAGSRPQGP